MIAMCDTPTQEFTTSNSDELRRLLEKNEPTTHNLIKKSKTEENKRVVIEKVEKIISLLNLDEACHRCRNQKM